MSDQKKAHILQQAWAAGVFDAKVTFPRSGYVVHVESADETLMKRFAATMPVGQFGERHKKGCPKGLWRWQTIAMDDTREALLMFAPFLSAIRLKQASEMVARIERSPIWQKKNPEKAASCVISPAPTAEAETTQPSMTPDGHTVTQ